jgi:hypothetical protein
LSATIPTFFQSRYLLGRFFSGPLISFHDYDLRLNRISYDVAGGEDRCIASRRLRVKAFVYRFVGAEDHEKPATGWARFQCRVAMTCYASAYSVTRPACSFHPRDTLLYRIEWSAYQLPRSEGPSGAGKHYDE